MYGTVMFENDSCRNVRTYHIKSDPTWSEPGFINGEQCEVSGGEEAAHMGGLCGRHDCGHHHTCVLQGERTRNLRQNSQINYEISLQTEEKSQCCGSGMFIPEPNFSIPDPGSASKNLSILVQKMVSKPSEI
jgi:hypothetical protein